MRALLLYPKRRVPSSVVYFRVRILPGWIYETELDRVSRCGRVRFTAQVSQRIRHMGSRSARVCRVNVDLDFLDRWAVLLCGFDGAPSLFRQAGLDQPPYDP